MSFRILLLLITVFASVSFSLRSFRAHDIKVHRSPLKLAAIIDNPDTIRYFLAGGIAASFSHGVAVPFDVIKTKIQTDPQLYPKSLGLLPCAQKIVDSEGLGVLLSGMGPTLTGYCIQGSLKYGFYELFKPLLLENFPFFDTNNMLLFISAGAMAELIGSSTLVPFEAARIRLVANPSYASGLQGAITRIASDEGELGTKYNERKHYYDTVYA